MSATFKLPDTLVRRLESVAAHSGRSADAIVREAVAKQLDYEEWFTEAVKEGFESGDREGWISHEEATNDLQARIEDYKRQLSKAA